MHKKEEVILYSDGTKKTEVIARELQNCKIDFRRVERPTDTERLPAVETDSCTYRGVREIQAYFLHGKCSR